MEYGFIWNVRYCRFTVYCKIIRMVHIVPYCYVQKVQLLIVLYGILYLRVLTIKNI